MWQQVEFQLPAMRRGFHLITDQVEAALSKLSPVSIGLLHVQLLHTSASLTINENADPSVRRDMERHFSHMVPEDQPYYEHIYEGSDDNACPHKSQPVGLIFDDSCTEREAVFRYLARHLFRRAQRSWWF